MVQFLVKCQGCKKELVVNQLNNFHNLLFEDLVNVVVCPQCGKKTKVSVDVSLVKENNND